MKLGGKSEIIGIAGYAFGESMIDSLVNQFAGNFGGISADMIELGLGYYLKKRSGIVGSIGKAMFTINLYNVIKTMVGGGFQLLTPTKTVTNGWS